MSNRERINHRLRHLRDHREAFPTFNIRSLLGTDSVSDLLRYGEFAVLQSIDDRLAGGASMQLTYDSANQLQNREFHVPLLGAGSASGRMEFEVEREHGGWKFELTFKVRNFAAGSHAVWLDGSQIGSVQVGGNGYGRLELSTDPGGGELPFSGGIVPEFKLGSTVQIGEALFATIGGDFPSTDGSVSTTTSRSTLRGPTSLLAFVEYEVEPEHGALKHELKVDVRNAAAGSVADFYIAGIDVADIPIDARGRGVVRFSTDPDSGELPFPIAPATIDVGTQLSINHVATGAFASLPSTVSGGAPPGVVEFQGGLSGPGSVRGGARYETQIEDGGFVERQFRVHVRDAAPGTEHTIRVDGIAVGTLTVGDDGRGLIHLSNRMDDPRELAMPASFPDVISGSRVDVGVVLSGHLTGPSTPLAFANNDSLAQSLRGVTPWDSSSLGLAAS